MSPLVKIRSERDQMSAVERRIADFILENAQLLRDYSSQQLANALGISQSSVVKFTQKLGFKGYPDLKYSVGEAIARNGGDAAQAAASPAGAADETADGLWRRKCAAEEETRLINRPETLRSVAEAIDRAGRQGRVFLLGMGDDDIHVRAFALRLAMLGILPVYSFDMVRMTTNVASAQSGDVLVVVSEFGSHVTLGRIARQFRERRGTLVTVTRHTANPLRAMADVALVVSAHDERPYIQSLLYQSATQHLLDRLFVLLCEGHDDRHAQLLVNLERIQHVLEP
ncbi:MurR/RpiR family transcriptional regulator [Fulvimonas soli]|jgi:DNA-binding MurR/RpiR family transcriptional regulator|uniref:RpiR family transcriptional regulator n=1 Tax=Fulvimonas soli TaxID=155197 RepID=A0A316HS26_9GAMM|nr:MurR/RpiR family transcriptional regulator [Fulvimonas soli]PWK82745.1 RpiR family transcriptional regulator [Fulvimonas soli]TNY26639.1 transcriptional regulator [Fulvimonas soli]